jgi:hypothetical protein
MPLLRFRLIGSREDADDLISTLHGLDGIEYIEELDDELAPRMRDDSSSSELVDDQEGHVYFVELETADDEMLVDAVRSVAEVRAEALGIGIEFVDEF